MTFDTQNIEPSVDPGSFRDPGGRVLLVGDRVFRTIEPEAQQGWRRFSRSSLFRDLQDDGRLIPTFDPDPAPRLASGLCGKNTELVEHERLPWISYPYEWSFEMLRAAALLHLDILDEALKIDFMIKDATAYNVQFLGVRPVFIDVLSFEQLGRGEPWAGYGQFCNLFLFPLMLDAVKGVAFQPWLRSSLEGIDVLDFSLLCGLSDWARPGVFRHVKLQAWLQSRLAASSKSVRAEVRSSGLPKSAIHHNIDSLRRIISKLKSRRTVSVWSEYIRTKSYSDESTAIKREFVERVATRARPKIAWDLGCNTGAFSRILARSAELVVSMDSDGASVDALYRTSSEEGIHNILPLVMNLANPSPGQGWRGIERQPLDKRGRPDLVLCLALIHHIVISANVPVRSFIEWLASITRRVIIEFVGREDGMVKKLLLNKDDSYVDYDQESFEKVLREYFSVEDSVVVMEGKRIMYYAVRK